MSVVAPQDRLAGAWNFSAVHSAVTFSVPYVVASFRASFEEVAATLVDGKLSGTAEVASVDVKDENLAAHLMSAEFFDADNHGQHAAGRHPKGHDRPHGVRRQLERRPAAGRPRAVGRRRADRRARVHPGRLSRQERSSWTISSTSR
jgi:hypothetical protein